MLRLLRRDRVSALQDSERMPYKSARRWGASAQKKLSSNNSAKCSIGMRNTACAILVGPLLSLIGSSIHTVQHSPLPRCRLAIEWRNFPFACSVLLAISLSRIGIQSIKLNQSTASRSSHHLTPQEHDLFPPLCVARTDQSLKGHCLQTLPIRRLRMHPSCWPWLLPWRLSCK